MRGRPVGSSSRPFPWRRRLVCVTLLAAVAAFPRPAHAADEAASTVTDAASPRSAASSDISVRRGTTLPDVLRVLQGHGLRIVWSEVLVHSWMRVDEDQIHGSAVATLHAILTQFNLKAEPGPGGTWLVVVGAPESRDAAPLGTVRGRVVDGATGVPIKGAVVQLGRRNTVATLDDGRFRFHPIAAQDHVLRVAAPEYRGFTTPVRPGADEFVVQLFPEVQIGSLSLEDVLVVASRYELYSTNAGTSHFLSREEIERLPHLADDSNRALHRLPGVAAGDWSAKFHLRGGLQNEVSLVVDGLELFEPFHLQDLFSPLTMLDANIIEGIELFSGGFGARYGDHMSGIVQIDTMEGGAERENEIGVSFVNAYGRSQGDFANHRGHWLASVRRGYLDLLLDQIEAADGDIEPRYYDLFVKGDYDVSDRLNIATHLLTANDDLKMVQDDGDSMDGDGRSSYAWVTVTADVSETVHGSTVLSVGQVERETRINEVPRTNGEFSTVDNRREVRVAGVKTDWEWLPTNRHMFTWGAEIRNLDANYDYSLRAVDFDVLFNDGSSRDFVRDSVLNPDGDEIGAYVSHRFRATDSIIWETGLRWDKQTYTNLSGQTQWSPRFNLLWAATADTELRLAWGRYFQPQHINELQVEDEVTNFFPAQRSTHQILSLSHRVSDSAQLRLEAYRKDYDSVRPRFENILNRFESVAEVQPDRVLISPESSLARGVELTFKQQINDRWQWWGSYTWSRVSDRLDGKNVPRAWDQRNALTAAVNWNTGKWNVNLTYFHHSGWPTSNLDGRVFQDANGETIFAATFDAINETQLGGYNRFDLRMTRSVPVRVGEFRWFVEVYNLFDAGNDCCVTGVNLLGNGAGGIAAEATFDPWMPLLPSFGFSWTF